MVPNNGVHALVRRTHEDRILSALRDHGALSRAQLAPIVGLSRTTLSEITGILIERGAIFVSETDSRTRTGRGRPAERLVLDPDAGQFIGVDFGHERVHVAVADASHAVIAAGTAPYPRDSEWNARIAAAFAALDELTERTGVHYGALQGVGIGVPAPVLHEAGSDEAVAEQSGRRMIESIEEAFLDRFGVSLLFDNNTQFAALAEAAWGDGAGVSDLVYLRLSHGCGGGLVVGGRLVPGDTGFAGELGHITVDQRGAQCSCGKCGCLETVASLPALIARCTGIGVGSAADLQGAAGRGEPAALAALAEAGECAGRVLAAVATALAPREVVLGGPVVDLHEVVLERAREAFERETLTASGRRPLLRAAQYGDGGAALGAIVAAFHSSPLLVAYPTMIRGTGRTTNRARSFR
ncbi:ROK family transcriptional regulator [Humibacter antri]